LLVVLAVAFAAGGLLTHRLRDRAVVTETPSDEVIAGPNDAAGLLRLGLCRTECAVTGKYRFSHPAWGDSVLLTTRSTNEERRDVNLIVIDGTGRVRWNHWCGDWVSLDIKQPVQDSTGNIFLDYNPGRYNGVLVLRPAPQGFQDFGSLPKEGDYQSRFYSAEAKDVDGDGSYEIDVGINDCDPSCAEGTYHHSIYRWTGREYAAQ
jgi:hypothetical protein